MDADQHPMTPDAIVDHELRALLAVDPSGEFSARVRTRIAEDPVRHAWLFPRVLVVSAAVVVTAVIATRLLSELNVAGGRAPKAIALHEPPSIALLGARPLPAFALVLPNQPFLPDQPLPPRDEPDILIDAREASALRTLIRRASEGRIDLRPALAATAPRVMELSPIDDVAIAPIVIVPLEEGARQ